MTLKTLRTVAAFCIAAASTAFAGVTASAAATPSPEFATLSKETLLDKIKGGWAGQTIGVTYGGPTEFKYRGRMIPDSVEIPWPGTGYIKRCLEKQPGLYDDIYMDLSFMLVFDKEGLDASQKSLGDAFARAGYKLWHANQAARYNILNGIPPPQSGHWKNNPHADDIDFQIEADFAGLMSPGMPNTASVICDKVGHIMNYGDGWYGGVYMAAMYSLAFTSDDINHVVNEGLKTIPTASTFHQCITDTIRWCAQNPDWRVTWQLLEDKWGANETGCPEGVSDPFNIDAKLNAAYVVMGLLYGKGDMGLTLDISTRCGADSDCNPASAGGILGTMIGYNKIPAKWLNDLKEAEDIKIAHLPISLNDTYRMSYEHALKVIAANSGRVDGENVVIKTQAPAAVRLEQSFEGLVVAGKEVLTRSNWDQNGHTLRFDGTGVVVEARVYPKKGCPKNYVAQIELELDGKKQIVPMPSDFTVRRFDMYWNFDLSDGAHAMNLKWLNPRPDAELRLKSFLWYKPKK